MFRWGRQVFQVGQAPSGPTVNSTTAAVPQTPCGFAPHPKRPSAAYAINTFPTDDPPIPQPGFPQMFHWVSPRKVMSTPAEYPGQHLKVTILLKTWYRS